MSTAGQGHQTPPWWAALPPAAVRVPCGDGTHQLRWEQGRLVAADHPDAEAELVLAALGGDRTECIELAEAWGSRSDDLEVLAVGPRSAADELTITRDEIDQLRLSGRGRMGFRGSRPMIAGGRGTTLSAGRSAAGTAGRGWPGSGPAAYAWRADARPVHRVAASWTGARLCHLRSRRITVVIEPDQGCRPGEHDHAVPQRAVLRPGR